MNNEYENKTNTFDNVWADISFKRLYKRDIALVTQKNYGIEIEFF